MASEGRDRWTSWAIAGGLLGGVITLGYVAIGTGGRLERQASSLDGGGVAMIAAPFELGAALGRALPVGVGGGAALGALAWVLLLRPTPRPGHDDPPASEPRRKKRKKRRSADGER